MVQGVFGLDNRPQAKPHFRRPGARAATHTFTPVQVAQLYNYPAKADGTGECVAIIELGGGFKSADLDAYWKQVNLTRTPRVTAVSVGNGSNAPTGDPNGPDAEVMLDIEAVSYTHLDVYKRQGRTMENTFITRRSAAAGTRCGA